MPPKLSRFTRAIGQRSYRKLFLIAAEGEKTEQQYFNFFNSREATIKVECLKSGHSSSPFHVLKRMKTELKKNELKDSDEAWLVVDKDQWTDEQLSELHTWSQEKENYGFALSNPKFEYWLLLHFEDGKGVQSSAQCSERLKQYLPDYNKGICINKFPKENIADAVRRAQQRDNPRCVNWPQNVGTTVYRLVERLIS
ncbi:RloB family protein [Candidatus Electronema sp. JM]|uniref:RloB family protein n=1 Tax=Candidatus Electronema sp. JM TaxID=3401571 RepID=UPI003AA80272